MTGSNAHLLSGELGSLLTGRHYTVELYPFDFAEFRVARPRATLADYLAFGCPFFAWSARKRAARNRKFYPVDTGLRRVAVTSTGKDRGKQLECATYLLLRRRFRQVSYWRGDGEVDFVVERDRVPIPIQVSWEEPTERARRAVDAFHEAHPTAAEPVFVTAKALAAGLPELPEPAIG